MTGDRESKNIGSFKNQMCSKSPKKFTSNQARVSNTIGKLFLFKVKKIVCLYFMLSFNYYNYFKSIFKILKMCKIWTLIMLAILNSKFIVLYNFWWNTVAFTQS